MTEITAGRENGRRRPKGYAQWRPQTKTVRLLDQVDAVLREYQEFLPLTVRQIFYRLVGAFGFEKTEQAYGRLSEALVRARRSRLIPFTSIRDDNISLYPVSWYSSVQAFHEETARRASSYRRNRQGGQPSRVELWTEAAGMGPQLAHVAHRYSVPVYSGGGFSSLSAVRDIVDRAVEWGGKTVLLHVGDYDPSGVSIFESIAQDAMAFVNADRVIETTTIEMQRVALTADQVSEHDLPTSPPKPTDSRSRNWAGQTCQVEALAPDVLAGIVDAAVSARFDRTVLEIMLDRERADRAELLGLPWGKS